MTVAIPEVLSSACRGARRLLPRLALGAATALMLVSCGGGSVADFEPRHLYVFGDENSVITDGTTVYPATNPDGTPNPNAGMPIPAGRKYTINALDDTTVTPPVDNPPAGPLNCAASLIWTQILAADYGFHFAECSDPSAGPAQALIYAKAGARVADLSAQIDARDAQGGFVDTDLVTVFVGQNDITDIYATVTSQAQCKYVVGDPDSSGSAAQTARARGDQLAELVNRIADGGDGGRVLFLTVPNQGLTPFALAERAAHTDFDRADCLEDLTNAFNAGLRSGVIQDGRFIGLVSIEDTVEVIADNPDSFDYEDVTHAACTVALPDCTKGTLIPAAADGGVYLWTDDRHFGPDMHSRLGDLARSRAHDNPF